MGSNVNITCVYSSPLNVAVNWIIDGNEFTHSQLMASPLYQVDSTYNLATDIGISTLTIPTINNNFTLQCQLSLDPVVNSAVGRLAVAGMFVR